MKIMFLGDVMGRAGRNAVIEALPGLREEHKLDFVIVNAENSAAGHGCTAKIADEIFEAGADVITLGASQDNTLYEHPVGALSNGNGVSMFAGRTVNGDLRRAAGLGGPAH